MRACRLILPGRPDVIAYSSGKAGGEYTSDAAHERDQQFHTRSESIQPCICFQFHCARSYHMYSRSRMRLQRDNG